jgi:hypothetical protein
MAKSKKPTKSTKPKVSKADREAKKAEIDQLKNSREYAELAGLLAQAAYKKVATVDWMNGHIPSEEASLEKATAKERERFMVALVRTGKAQKVLNELKDLPSREYKELFAQLAGMSPARATEKLKALTPTKLKEFCKVNEITPVVSGAKQAFSKAKTIEKAAGKLRELSEYLKL